VSVQAIQFLIGCILLALAILGGGVEVKELKIPPLSATARVLIAVLGLICVGIALAQSSDRLTAASQGSGNDIAVSPTPSTTAAEAVISDRLGRRQINQVTEVFIDGEPVGTLRLSENRPTAAIRVPATGRDVRYLLTGSESRRIDGQVQQNTLSGEGVVRFDPESHFCIRATPAAAEQNRLLIRLAPLRECH